MPQSSFGSILPVPELRNGGKRIEGAPSQGGEHQPGGAFDFPGESQQGAWAGAGGGGGPFRSSSGATT